MSYFQVHLWTVQIPLPKVPPIVVAALPISDKLDVQDLLPMLESVLFGLLKHDVNVISYSCNGTETERSIQKEISNKANSYTEIIISDPQGGPDEVRIKIPVFFRHPVTMIQDSKHGLKAAQNNLFSGAHLLVMGNFVSIYQQVYNVAFQPDSPLYHRDVVKLDRQDDNAAARLFSATTLQYISDKYPEELGLIVYLFIFGELCDAYQNRCIDHRECIKIVLRTRYFVNMWQRYINQCHVYQMNLYFLSWEFTDILSFMIDGLISLVIIHQDWLPDSVPLLPWLHSTEPTEHVFGVSRQIVTDFTMGDFLHMQPKLHLRLQEAIHSQLSHSHMQASGYNHMYFDTHDIDLLALGIFPSTSTIQSIACEAMEEADSLVHLLGIVPGILHVQQAQLAEQHLPPIPNWAVNSRDDSDSKSVNLIDSKSSDPSDSAPARSEMEQLFEAIHSSESQQNIRASTSAEVARIDTLTNAAIGLALDDNIRMYVNSNQSVTF